jgi:hypothetical protein
MMGPKVSENIANFPSLGTGINLSRELQKALCPGSCGHIKKEP